MSIQRKLHNLFKTIIRLSKKNYPWIGILLIIIYSFPYFYIFHQGISSNIEDFSGFGSYLSGLGAIISAITLFYLISQNIELKNGNLIENRRKSLIFLLENYDLKMNSFGQSFNNMQRIKRIRFLKDRIELIIKDDIELEFFKNYLRDKIPQSTIQELEEDSPNEDCLKWLRMDTIHYRLNREKE